jgi:hypothetical protein
MFWVILMVFILLFAYLAYQYAKSDKHKRSKVKRELNESCGGWDAHAKAAHAELAQVKEKTARDLFLDGYIMQYYMLENEPRASAEYATLIMNDYIGALYGMAPQDDDVQAQLPFMLDKITDFGRALQLDGDVIEDDRVVWTMNQLDNALIERAPALRRATVEQKRQNIAKKAPNKKAAAAQYLHHDLINDGQNVHDTLLGNDLAHFYDLIKTDGPAADRILALTQAKTYIENHLDGAKRDAALQTLARISENNYVSKFNDHEGNIFAHVWERYNHPNNVANADLMRDAIASALVESVEDGVMVCTMGRTARVLNSPMFLDYDISISNGAMTSDAYKKQIYDEVKQIIDQEVATAALDQSAPIRAVAQSYTDPSVKPTPEAEAEFNRRVHNKIDDNLLHYTDKFTAADIENLRHECYAAI